VILAQSSASQATRPTTELRVRAPRIMQHLQAFSQYGKNSQGGVSRVAYSDADRQGREYAMQLMRDAGLDVTIDSAANILVRARDRTRR
jgi:N-carbamoyl-L-amino-acid hydrolase